MDDSYIDNEKQDWFNIIPLLTSVLMTEFQHNPLWPLVIPMDMNFQNLTLPYENVWQ